MSKHGVEKPLLGCSAVHQKHKTWRTKAALCYCFLAFLILSILGAIFGGDLTCWTLRRDACKDRLKFNQFPEIIESEKGVVAADDRRCSEIGASMLRKGGHAVDAAVATTLCVGVVNPMASGIGGGAFMVVRSSATSKAQAFDSRETAPLAASQNMYANNIQDKYVGPLSIGVPGEIAGLYEAWLRHGRLAWRDLFQPAIRLARDGFIVHPYLRKEMADTAKKIMNDPGLREVFARNGKLLQTGDTCYNVELARSLEKIAEQGPQALYNGTVGEKLVMDVKRAGGILTMEDLQNYRVEITDAVTANVMGYTVHGMPPPSGGTLGLAMVLNILDSYGTLDAAKGDIGLHRLIEALKHMFAVRMNLGDPKFVDIKKYASQMLSRSYAEQIQKRIVDNTTFPPEYYLSRWSQLRDRGTSHYCIVDADRNAVSMTTTVNYPFGAGLLSRSTGIVLNNEMGDFSAPTEITPDMLPPGPSNFIEANKRPLSSMTPIIVTKDDQVIGVLGGSGGMDIIPAVIQVFVNHFVLGLEPLVAVEKPRVYHRLEPNIVKYENWTVLDGDHIELADETKLFLKGRGHKLEAKSGGAIVQLIVQSLQNTNEMGRKIGRDSQTNQILHGKLTAVSDPRKDGRPAAV